MRLAIGIEYDGTEYMGWQSVIHGPSVQQAVEAAVSRVAGGETITLYCAGRTDSGVHARCQVAHFDTEVQRSMRSWTLGANANLAEDISVLWCQPVDDKFHARYHAMGRGYRYRILNRKIRPAIERRRVAWLRHPLDHEAMHEAAQALCGEHDYSSFRAARCQAKSPLLTMREITARRCDDQVVVDISGNRFLHNMVRIIIGTLVPVGIGERPLSWPGEVLAACNRDLAGITMPARGLEFLGPQYPEQYGIRQ